MRSKEEALGLPAIPGDPEPLHDPDLPKRTRLRLELEVLRVWSARHADDKGNSRNQETHHVACILKRMIDEGRIVTT